MVFNTGPYTELPDNSILITANMQSETGFPSSHQLKSYIAASKSRLKLAARAVLSADAGLLVVLYVRFHNKYVVYNLSLCLSCFLVWRINVFDNSLRTHSGGSWFNSTTVVILRVYI